MKRRSVLAGELIEQLNNDPAYLALMAKKEEAQQAHQRAVRAEGARLTIEIRACGYDIDSVNDLVNNSPHPVLVRRFTGPYEKAYPVLLRHLKLPYSPAIREAIIRALIVKDGGPSVAQALLEQFYLETQRELTWVLAHALRHTMSLKARKAHPTIATVLGR